jgi:formate dehydrogenase iron-sulfur subunit
MKPACAKACPTASIQFGDIEQLKKDARARVEKLHGLGMKEAYLYGADAESQPGTEGLNAFFLLLDEPEVYNLPPDPVVPTKRSGQSWASLGAGILVMAAAAVGAVLAGREGGCR